MIKFKNGLDNCEKYIIKKDIKSITAYEDEIITYPDNYMDPYSTGIFEKKIKIHFLHFDKHEKLILTFLIKTNRDRELKRIMKEMK